MDINYDELTLGQLKDINSNRPIVTAAVEP